MKRRRLSRARVLMLALALALAPSAAGGAAGAVEATQGLEAEVTVVGGTGASIPLEEVDENRPLRLDPDREVVLELEVENGQDEDVVLRTVRVEGRVLGMTFFDYATRVDRRIPAGATEELSLPLDVAELGQQAVGLLPARLTLTGEDRQTLYEDPFPVEVEGSLGSTYGVFGLLVAAVTVVLLLAALVRLAVGALPRHRWLRASRFAVPGLGLGLTLTFTLSVFRALVPSAESWAAIVVGGGLLGLLAGFATPAPDVSRRRERAEQAWTPLDEPVLDEVERDDRAPDEPAVYQAAGPRAQEHQQDEDLVIVLPDEATSAPPEPRRPQHTPARSDADVTPPPRPTRRP